MEIINHAKDIYYSNPIGWNVFIGVLILLAATYFNYRYDNKNKNAVEELQLFLFRPRGRGKMLRRARRDFVRRQAIDDFVHSVEERVYHGTYTRDEAKELYRDAKKVWPISDLFPSPELLKENIRTRMAATSKNLPVPLPDANTPPRRKHMFDKGELAPAK